MNRFRRNAFRILGCLALFPLVLSVASAARLEGKVKKGTYSSPAKNFTVPVPQSLGMRISDGYSRDAAGHIGAVSFHDDFGGLLAIHYMSLPPDAVAALAKPGALEPGLKNWLEFVAMPHWFASAVPASRLTHAAFGEFEGMGAYLARVEIPEGSPLVSTDAQGKSKRLDSTRGLVVFTRENYIYMLAVELKGIGGLLWPHDAPPPDSAADPSDKWMQYTEGIKPFYRSIAFLE